MVDGFEEEASQEDKPQHASANQVFSITFGAVLF